MEVWFSSIPLLKKKTQKKQTPNQKKNKPNQKIPHKQDHCISITPTRTVKTTQKVFSQICKLVNTLAFLCKIKRVNLKRLEL